MQVDSGASESLQDLKKKKRKEEEEMFHDAEEEIFHDVEDDDEEVIMMEEEDEEEEEEEAPSAPPPPTQNGKKKNSSSSSKAVMKKSTYKKKKKKRKPEKRVRKDGTPYKQRQWRPGTVALREIKRYQKMPGGITPIAIVDRTIRRHIEEIGPEDTVRLAAGTVHCVREIMEAAVVELVNCCVHIRANCNGQIVLNDTDAKLYQHIRFKNQLSLTD